MDERILGRMRPFISAYPNLTWAIAYALVIIAIGGLMWLTAIVKP